MNKPELNIVLLDDKLIPNPNKIKFNNNFYKSVIKKSKSFLLVEELCYDDNNTYHTYWHEKYNVNAINFDFMDLEHLEQEGIEICWHNEDVFDLKKFDEKITSNQ